MKREWGIFRGIYYFVRLSSLTSNEVRFYGWFIYYVYKKNIMYIRTILYFNRKKVTKLVLLKWYRREAQYFNDAIPVIHTHEQTHTQFYFQ